MLSMIPVSPLPPPSIAMASPALKPTVDATGKSESPAATADVNLVDTGVSGAMNEDAVDEGIGKSVAEL